MNYVILSIGMKGWGWSTENGFPESAIDQTLAQLLLDFNDAPSLGNWNKVVDHVKETWKIDLNSNEGSNPGDEWTEELKYARIKPVESSLKFCIDQDVNGDEYIIYDNQCKWMRF